MNFLRLRKDFGRREEALDAVEFVGTGTGTGVEGRLVRSVERRYRLAALEVEPRLLRLAGALIDAEDCLRRLLTRLAEAVG